MKTGSWCTAALAALTLAALAGCDQKLAVQPARDHQAADETPATALASLNPRTDATTSGERSRDSAYTPRAEAQPVKLIQGKPMWSDNRRHSAVENAQYQFDHHGAELGARDVDDYVAKAHRFLNGHDEGVLTLTRANGDRLMYDPKTQLFGVVRSDGAPRTVFKPDDGKAYWAEQVASKGGDNDREPRQRRTASRDSGDRG